MWRNNRDRPDDPATRERETQRLARDEYDRPRYGSPPGDLAPSAAGAAGWNHGAGGTPPQRDMNPWRQATQAQQPQRDARGMPMHGNELPAQRPRNMDEVRVHEIMTRRVTSVHPATSVERAARLMEECDCGALPVIGDSGVLVGMVTDRDIAIRIVARGRDTRNAIVADCMTERVFACYANECVSECMHQMARHQVRRMPIVDERGRLVGIIAQGDLARHAAQHALPDERRVLAETVGALSQPSHMPYR